MRTIKFRGKITGDDKWVYGSLVYSKKEDQYYIVEQEGEELSWEVDKESVGQSTGLLDKNGKEIFEGDIMGYKYWEDKRDEIKFLDGSFKLVPVQLNNDIDICRQEVIDRKNLFVIGNRFENPELLTNNE